MFNLCNFVIFFQLILHKFKHNNWINFVQMANVKKEINLLVKGWSNLLNMMIAIFIEIELNFINI